MEEICIPHQNHTFPLFHAPRTQRKEKHTLGGSKRYSLIYYVFFAFFPFFPSLLCAGKAGKGVGKRSKEHTKEQEKEQ
jgi:hypothetical protein